METAMMEGEDYYNQEGEEGEGEGEGDEGEGDGEGEVEGEGEWTQKVDTGQLCRVCANSNEYLIPIFDGEGLEHELGTKIQKHLPIKVTETDNLPQHMCYQCASTLIAWHDLVISCVEADKKLRELQIEENDDDDDDKGAEMFESPSLDSEMTEDAIQPSTSETQNQVSKTPAPRKPAVVKEKKSKLKMILVKGPPAGTSGQKTASKTQVVAKALELAKSKDGVNQDSASERSHGLGKTDFQQDARTTLQAIGNTEFLQSLKLENCVNSENENEHLYSIWIKTDEDDKEYYLCDVKELENDVQITKAKRETSYDVPEDELNQCEVNWNQNTNSQLTDHDYVQSSESMSVLNKKFAYEHVLKLDAGSVSGLVKASKKYIYKCVKIAGKCHAKLVPANQPVQCRCCFKYFRNEAVSLTHLRTHTGFSPFYCKYCGRSFMLSSSLKQHISYCTQAVSKTLEAKVSHPLTKGNNEKYMCTICGKMYKLKPSLKDHLRAHFGKARRKQKCDVCGEKFLTKAEIKEHMLTHKCGTFFTCDACNKTFVNERDLVDHMISHTDERPFCCSLCGATYKRKSHLNRHALSHEAHRKMLLTPRVRRKPGVVFKCHYCGKDWPTPRLLMLHQISHTGERNFECRICGKRFAQSGALSRHIHVVHEGAKDYTCEICLQSFTAKATKENHMRIHTGEKPFQCDTCGKTFRTQQQHRIHERVHTDMRPYPCPYCEKRFRRRPHLIVHIRTHTGEKPYACQVCGRCFAQKNDMTKHMQIHNR